MQPDTAQQVKKGTPFNDRTDLRKWTHQCDETQGNNNTRALSTKIVFFGSKKIEKKRKEAKKRTDKKELM